MRIVTWNCNMAFRKKIKYLLEKYNPDVMLIQECEEPLKFECFNEEFNILWIGDNLNKGLAVFARKNFKLEKININVGEVKYLLAVKVDNLKILNFWAMDDKQDRQQRYIAQVWQGLKACKEAIDDYTIVAGDFNWNVIWDVNPSYPLYGKMIDVINELESVDIKSLYHTKMQEQFGKESQSTFFMYRKQNKKYHTDYVFVPQSILEQVNNLEIGEYSEWSRDSDHMPIMFEIDVLKIIDKEANISMSADNFFKKYNNTNFGIEVNALAKESFRQAMVEAKKQAEMRAKEVQQKWKEIIEAALIKMGDAGWTLPMIMSIKPIEHISTLDNKKIDDFFCEYFSYDDNRNFKELVLDIQKLGIDKNFKVAIEQCICAYNQNLYIIVINTLLAVIEGVLSSFYPDKNNIRMIMICKNNIDKLTNDEDNLDMKKYCWQSYLSFITKLYTKSDFSSNEPDFINRHWLLHGRSSYDVTKSDCLRLFNAISTIGYIVENK